MITKWQLFQVWMVLFSTMVFLRRNWYLALNLSVTTLQLELTGGNCWLLAHIGLSERDNVEVKEDCRSYQEQRLGSLRKWRNKLGNGATIILLAEALFKISRADLVGELCKIYLSMRQLEEEVSASEPSEAPPEYERLLNCKEQMISEISGDLQTVSRKLAENDLIPSSLCLGVGSEPQESHEERVTKIVECLLRKVRFFPEKYYLLMSALSECSWMDDLVELLSGIHGESPMG